MIKLLLKLTFLAGSITSFNCLLSSVALAEIIPDVTLPENSRINRQGDVRVINGGTQQGTNLFHSFEEFSIPVGATARFNNNVAIKNIFARVTGGSRSEINGNISAQGSANLFLLNPNGILFGRDASLNIGGSFLATTGENIDFGNGTQFSAVDPQPVPLLTVNAPVGVQFGFDPQPIINALDFQQEFNLLLAFRFEVVKL
jgi:filamentous hemagglutinin family protein